MIHTQLLANKQSIQSRCSWTSHPSARSNQSVQRSSAKVLVSCCCSRRHHHLGFNQQSTLGVFKEIYIYMGVSENGGTLKSSILIRISIINHPFWGTPIFGNTHIYTYIYIYPINTHYIRCTVYRVDYEGPSIPRVPSFCIWSKLLVGMEVPEVDISQGKKSVETP